MTPIFHSQAIIPAPLQILKAKGMVAILFFLLLPVFVKSQTDINIQFAKVLAGTGNKRINCFDTDAAGNIYVAGNFSGTIDFDPGQSVQNLTSAGSTDIFFAKYNSNGGYVFAKRIGAANTESANGMDVDSAGNIYLCGSFMDAPDFDPGVVAQNLVSVQGSEDAFFAKYSTNGSYIFANSIGALDRQDADVIKADAVGNIYLAGKVINSADFDPGPGTLISIAGPGACYVAKYNATGGHVYSRLLRPAIIAVKEIVPVDNEWQCTYCGIF